MKIIDLHMHTTISDGTDSMEELIQKVDEAEIELFSVTDHDSIRAGIELPDLLTPESPAFIRGVEFSCKDELGKYHILGYGYDPQVSGIAEIVAKGHALRMKKTYARLQFLKEGFGFDFPPKEIEELLAKDNPGKPHIAEMIVRHGYAEDIQHAIKDFINKKKFENVHVSPQEAIEGILASGGIPVLAHPAYGDGDDLILGEDLIERVQYLMGFGLAGLEAYYSGFTDKIQNQVLEIAEKHGLYVTAGSDYHGKNKLVPIGDTNLDDISDGPAGMQRFLEDVTILNQ